MINRIRFRKFLGRHRLITMYRVGVKIGYIVKSLPSSYFRDYHEYISELILIILNYKKFTVKLRILNVNCPDTRLYKYTVRKFDPPKHMPYIPEKLYLK